MACWIGWGISTLGSSELSKGSEGRVSDALLTQDPTKVVANTKRDGIAGCKGGARIPGAVPVGGTDQQERLRRCPDPMQLPALRFRGSLTGQSEAKFFVSFNATTF
jgi:hypothetical protein